MSILYRLCQFGLPPEFGVKEVLVRIQVRLVAYQQAFRHVYFALQRFSTPQGRAAPICINKSNFVGVLTDFDITFIYVLERIKMPHSKFYYNLMVAMLAVSFGSSVCRIRKNDAETNTLHSLAPIVVTAQQGNDANGLIVHADPATDSASPCHRWRRLSAKYGGFNSIQSGGTNGDVTFRGMFGSRIKILTDGTENLGACPNRMDAPTYISPESYDRISVIKGPQTVQYANTGSAATVLFERQLEKLTSENLIAVKRRVSC